MTELAGEVLRFAGAHPLVCADQAVRLIGAELAQASMTLHALCSEGLLAETRVLSDGASWYRITESGLAEAGIACPAPTLALTDLRRVIYATWLWIVAQDGRFAGARVMSEWEMIAADLALARAGRGAGGPARACGLRIGGVRASRASGLHYPDFLIAQDRYWTAVHVQFAAPAADQLAALLTAYGADERYQQLRFMVEDPRVAEQIHAAAVTAGVAGMLRLESLQR